MRAIDEGRAAFRGFVLLLITAGLAWGADKSGVAPSAISLPKGPGSIEGLGESFQPNLNTGTAKYGIPVSVPPGTAGHTPQTGLRYEAGSGNGPLGFGWNLPLSYIQRRTDKGIPLYGAEEDFGVDRTDIFINEQKEELVPHANGYFFCRNEGAFIRYRPVDDHWEGITPDGTRLEFGLTGGGRIQDTDSIPSRVFSWMLEQETDVRGNAITYAYESFPDTLNTRQVYLSQIRYGPGSPPWDNFHFVVFAYEDRPDWFEDCRPGFVVRTGKRLKSVTVGTQGPALEGHQEGDFNADGLPDRLFRRYEFEYLDYAGDNTHWSLLTSVQVVGADGASRLPASRFDYAVCDPPSALSASGRQLDGTNEPSSVMDSPSVELADLNGDGLPDLLRTFAGGGVHQGFLNLGLASTGSGKTIAWSDAIEVGGDQRAWNVDLGSGTEVAHLADMNGDGLADLVVKSAAQEVFYFGNDGRMNWVTRERMASMDVVPPTPFGHPDVRTADLDFDKRIDVVQSVDIGGGLAYRLWLNLGDQTYSSPMTVSQAGYAFSQPGVHLVDFNGDRVPDLIRIFANRLEAMAGLGYGRFADPILVELPDVILTQEQIARARLIDLTADGLTDLVLERAGPGVLWYWVNQGTYALGDRREIVDMPVSLSANAAVRWADLNGNGTTDLVYADSAANPRLVSVDLGDLINCGAAPNSLQSIDNGLGRRTLIEFQPSTSFALADAAAGQPWPDPMPFPVQVVAAVTTLDSLGHEYVTRYRYHDGYYDQVEKQFRGFARVEQVEVGDPTAPTLVSRSYFDHGRSYQAMKGRLLRQTVEQEDGAVFTDDVTVWSDPPRVLSTGTNGTEVRFAHPVGTLRRIRELDRGTERQIESEFRFDDYGNQTQQAYYGVVEQGDRGAFQDERVVTTEFALNLDRWILRLPKRQETTTLDDVVISRTEHYYDDETFSGTNSGEVTLGNLTLERDWIDPADPAAYVTSTRYQYDIHGNAIAMLDPLAVAPDGEVDLSRGHVRTIEYDDRFHTYPVRETVHPGGGAAPLVYEAKYDESFGTMLRAIDLNTNMTHYTYDPFGRLTSIRKPGDLPDYPTSEYSYVLAEPVGADGVVNYVETRLLDQPAGTHGTHREHYMISREFTDGLGRKLMVKKEAEPQNDSSSSSVVVSSAVTFNARRAPALALNPFFSVAAVGEDVLAFEAIEDAGWRGLFHESGNLVSLSLEEAQGTRTVYDATLREIESVNPDGGRETTVYEPLLARSYDANQSDPASAHHGAHMVHFNDGLGRLIRVDEVVRLEDDGTRTDDLSTWTTRYEYDANDQLTRIVDSQNNVKVMTYDGLARKITMNDPDRGMMWFSYDAAGNLVETVDAKEQRISYTYDGVNRMRSEDYHDLNPDMPAFDPAQPITAIHRPDVAYFYDVPAAQVDAGDGTLLMAQNTAGMLTYVWDLTGEEHYSYDARERATALVKRIFDPLHGRLVSYRTGYSFDSLDRLAQVTYPDDDIVRYEYNERSLGRRILGGPTGSVISDLRYSPAGQITRIEYGNGVQTQSAYDANLRLEWMRTRHTQVNLDHVAFEYEFDAASNLRTIRDLRPGAAVPDGSARRNTQRIEFDDLYRLTAVRYSFGVPEEPPRNDGEIRYRYDRIGNLLAQTSTIATLEQGRPVTDLGVMEYGGAAGRGGRTGRGAGDPPGPHALTQIEHQDFDVRVFAYDANGNMLEIDGLQATWDFEDRLTTLENGTMQANYGYDHRDARILKKVRRKGADGIVQGPVDSTVYVNRYFEVRQNGLATKYVWCGDTRIARVTSQISPTPRLQRIRLWSGWNLCSLAVTADQAREQFAAGGIVSAVYRWDLTDHDFKEVTAQESVPAGAALWVHALAEGTVTVRGHFVEEASPTLAPVGGIFHPGSPQEALNFDGFVPPPAAVWRFDAEAQRWQARLSEVMPGFSSLPERLVPGEAVFIRADADTALELPDLAKGIRYYHQDHLGSSSVITDASGTALEETAFYPFGAPRHRQTSLAYSDPYQFIQKERDQESGLNCLEARFQSPILARFLRVDPLAGALKSSWLQEPQRLNLYAYCANAPFANIDPNGTDLLGTVVGAQNAMFGFYAGVAEAAWEARPRDPVTTVVSATVGIHQTLKAKGEKIGDIAYAAIGEKDYKKAAILAISDERVTKIMDPKTSDFQMGRVIGNETGKALITIATSAAPGAAAPKGPVPPPVRPPALPPARVVVGRPMSASGQVGSTQPALGKGPTTKVAQPVENPTLVGKKGLARDVANEARIAENNKRTQAAADAAGDRLNKRMRETQDLRDWLTSEGQHELVRKYVGDILNE